MPALTRESCRRVSASGVLVLTVVALVVFAPGCGSGGDDTSSSTVTNTTQGGETAPEASVPEANRDRPKRSSSTQEKVRSKDSQADAARAAARSKRRSVAREVAADCPPALTSAQCKAAVRAVSGGASHAIHGPRDCLDVMSRSKCEALAVRVQEAFEKHKSYGLDECLRTRTPKCEEVFGPVLEQQRAAKGE